MPENPKLGFYPRYTSRGASSRHRFYDYAELWQQKCGSAPIHPFFSDHYLSALYSGKKKSLLLLIAAWMRRFILLFFLPKKLIIEYELMPFFPAWFELIFLRKRNFFLNFDDLVQMKYQKYPLLAGKFEKLMKHASGVICANEKLLEIASKHNSNCIKLSTALKLEPFNCCTEKFHNFTVVWIGTPITYVYLLDAAEKLRKMAESVEFELLVIAGENLSPIQGVKCRFVAWNEKTEAELLKKCHVGIMPLPENDLFASGKSAFKLIQYCAAGLPAIATDSGENKFVLRDGITGYLATTPDEWAKALSQIHDQRDTYSKMVDAALNLAPEFSLETSFEKFKNFIRSGSTKIARCDAIKMKEDNR